MTSPIAKHVCQWRNSSPSHSLTTLSVIEDCLASAPNLFSPREAEVCARILNGVSTAGIADELGISEETVSTYRKRAYHRLAIGSQRELLLWYLDFWAQCKRELQMRPSQFTDDTASGRYRQMIAHR